MLISATPQSYASKPCDETHNAYGPFDYTNPGHFRNKLPIVESHHFTPKVESLQAGEEGTITSDLDYTLRAFPNHHRALYSMMRFQIVNPHRPGDRHNDIQCYFQRALIIQPNDAAVYQLWGMYHHKKKDYKSALERYEISNRINPNNPELLYNMGLTYFELKDYKNSVKFAKQAYELGYPFNGLKRKLQRQGLW